MGIKSVSLPDGLIKELEDAAKEGVRGFSAEVLMRLEREKAWRGMTKVDENPTGVAEGRLDSTIKFSDDKVYTAGEEVKPGWLGIAEKSDEATAKLETEVEKMLEPAKEAIREAVDEVVLNGGLRGGKLNKFRKATMGKFSGVTELAKKIAKDIPGVAVASEVSGLPLPVKFNKIMADEPRDGSLDQEGITDKMRKSAKKRPVETEGRVELVKGFWRETFDSVGDAMVEVAQKGWKEGEYTIKPLK